MSSAWVNSGRRGSPGSLPTHSGLKLGGWGMGGEHVWPQLSVCAQKMQVGFNIVSDSMRPRRLQPTRLPRPWDSPGKNTGVSCHFLLQCMKVKSDTEVAQSCPTLSNPMDCSPPGSSIHGIFQARALEWGATAFSKVGKISSYNSNHSANTQLI